MKSKYIHLVKQGKFNSLSQNWQPDGSVIITLSKRGEGKLYKLHVQALYKDTEVVLSEELIQVK